VKAFKDSGGRPWVVEVNVTTARRVKALLGVNLLTLVGRDGAKALGDLLDDHFTLVDVLYVLCLDQAGAEGVTDEGFGRLMGGDVLEAAADAFLEALIDFFPNPRERAGLRAVIGKAREVRDLELTAREARLAGVSPAEILKRLSGTSPAS